MDVIDIDHVPEIILGLLGTIALLIVTYYLKNRDSFVYKLLVLFGVTVGIIAAALYVISPMGVAKGTLIITAVGCFTLIIRPFRNVHFALVIAILGMAVVYIFLADVHEPIDFLNNGLLRIAVSFVVGSIIYMIFGFAQAIVLGLGKFLNAWPVLTVVGIFCIIEAICLCIGCKSILDTIIDFAGDKTIV